MHGLYIDGERVETPTELDEREGFRVQVEGGYYCHDCGTEDPEYHGDDCENTSEAAPCSFANSAAINFDPEDDAVTVMISVGDPRGAFAFTVRRLDDGRLIMHTPYQGEGFGHLPLIELHAGTYAIDPGALLEGDDAHNPPRLEHLTAEQCELLLTSAEISHLPGHEEAQDKLRRIRAQAQRREAWHGQRKGALR